MSVIGRPAILVPFPYALDHDQAGRDFLLVVGDLLLELGDLTLEAFEGLAADLTGDFREKLQDAFGSNPRCADLIGIGPDEQGGGAGDTERVGDLGFEGGGLDPGDDVVVHVGNVHVSVSGASRKVIVGVDCRLRVGIGADHRFGDRVTALLAYGGFASRVTAPPERVFAMPDAMSFEAGAALGIVYQTSYVALVPRAALKAGETLLIVQPGTDIGKIPGLE